MNLTKRGISMKKIFLILYLLIGITSVKAGCYKYARAGGISNRTNGHLLIQAAQAIKVNLTEAMLDTTNNEE